MNFSLISLVSMNILYMIFKLYLIRKNNILFTFDTNIFMFELYMVRQISVTNKNQSTLITVDTNIFMFELYMAH